MLAGLQFVRLHRREIAEYEHALNERLRRQMADIPGVRVLGDEAVPRVGITSIVPPGGDSSALADALDATGVAVRAGLHCAPAIHHWLGTMDTGSVRFSPGVYTTEADVDDAAALTRRLLR